MSRPPQHTHCWLASGEPSPDNTSGTGTEGGGKRNTGRAPLARFMLALAPCILRKSRYCSVKLFCKLGLKWTRRRKKLVFLASPALASPVKPFWMRRAKEDFSVVRLIFPSIPYYSTAPRDPSRIQYVSIKGLNKRMYISFIISVFLPPSYSHTTLLDSLSLYKRYRWASNWRRSRLLGYAGFF